MAKKGNDKTATAKVNLDSTQARSILDDIGVANYAVVDKNGTLIYSSKRLDHSEARAIEHKAQVLTRAELLQMAGSNPDGDTTSASPATSEVYDAHEEKEKEKAERAAKRQAEREAKATERAALAEARKESQAKAKAERLEAQAKAKAEREEAKAAQAQEREAEKARKAEERGLAAQAKEEAKAAREAERKAKAEAKEQAKAERKAAREAKSAARKNQLTGPQQAALDVILAGGHIEWAFPGPCSLVNAAGESEKVDPMVVRALDARGLILNTGQGTYVRS